MSPQVPEILRSDGTPFFGDDYHFTPGRDDMIVGEGEACDGYIVSYSDALYRALDAVTRLRSAGINVGLVNKCHVNAPDEAMMRTIGKENARRGVTRPSPASHPPLQ